MFKYRQFYKVLIQSHPTPFHAGQSHTRVVIDFDNSTPLQPVVTLSPAAIVCTEWSPSAAM